MNGPGSRLAARAGRRALGAASRYWPVPGVLAAWQAWVSAEHYNEIVAPAPAAVFSDVFGHAGAYAGPLAWTLGMSAAGLALGMALGALLALVVWSSPLAAGLVTPIALVMRSVPVVAMIPIMIGVAGLGISTVLIVTTAVSFFPTFVLLGSGLRSAPAIAHDLFTVLDASRLTRLRRLLLPHAIPSLLVALRMTAPAVILAAMLAEYLIGTHGLGFLFVNSMTFSRIDRAWGTGVVATAVSVTAFAAARAAERWGTGRMT